MDKRLAKQTNMVCCSVCNWASPNLFASRFLTALGGDTLGRPGHTGLPPEHLKLGFSTEFCQQRLQRINGVGLLKLLSTTYSSNYFSYLLLRFQMLRYERNTTVVASAKSAKGMSGGHEKKEQKAGRLRLASGLANL